MTSREFAIKLTHFRDSLPEMRDKLLLDAVFSAAALVKQRVIRGREKADGGIFGKYSKKYLQYRIKKGKGQNEDINFSFTGKMWQSTQPFILETADDHVIVRVQPLDSARADVMGFHDKRFGPILSLNDEEVGVISDDFTSSLQDFINKSFT